jgi:hypothetical protein
VGRLRQGGFAPQSAGLSYGDRKRHLLENKHRNRHLCGNSTFFPHYRQSDCWGFPLAGIAHLPVTTFQYHGRLMPLYRSYQSVPELAGLPKDRAKAIFRDCVKKNGVGLARYIVTFIPIYLGIYFLIGPLLRVLIPSLGNGFIFCMARSGCAGYPAILVFQHFQIAAAIPLIRKRVGGLCLNCGYDVRATPELCPECGKPIEQAVQTKTNQTPVL